MRNKTIVSIQGVHVATVFAGLVAVNEAVERAPPGSQLRSDLTSFLMTLQRTLTEAGFNIEAAAAALAGSAP